MKKSSRFWWLHGAILVAAVVGCKSNSGYNGGGGSYGPTGQGNPPPINGGAGGMYGSAGGVGYHQSGGMPAMGGSPAGMAAGQAFAPQGGGGYGGPATSSGFGSH